MKKKIELISLLIFIGTLFVYTFFTYFSEGRVWGFNIWAYLSNSIVIVNVTLALIIAMLIYLFREKIYAVFSKLNFKITASILTVVLVASFVFLRVRTYFLGDGYTILSLISSGNPLIEKKRQLIESYAHIYLYNILGGDGLPDAILSYQLISYFAGILFVLTVIYASVKLFEESFERVLFFVGLVSGGYMLLFFGYAEHYSLFAFFVLFYLVVSMMILKKHLPKWIIIPVTITTCLTHIFGVSLIPSMIYLLIVDTGIEKFLKRQNRIIKICIFGVPLVMFIVFFIYYYKTDFFFQISLVPLIESRLTQEGYTSFSINHLLDMVNLLVLLLPGFLILLFSFISSKPEKILGNKIYVLASLIILSTFGLAFIFDPKLGMPRDWDLFAFWTIPLSFYIYYAVLHQLKAKAVVPVLLSVVLGFAVLIPRAYSLTQDDVSIKHFRDYLYLDKVKNRNSWILLENYYKDKGDSIQAEQIHQEWLAHYPEKTMMKDANILFYQERKPVEARQLLYEILEVNPTYPDAYAFLGFIYLYNKQIDSSIYFFRLSDALSPNRATNLDNLARAYHEKGDYEKALKYFKMSNSLDSTNYVYKYNIARLYLNMGDSEKYHKFLQISAGLDGAVDLIHKELLVSYLRRSEINKAKELIKNNVSLQNDTLFIKQVESQTGIKLF